MDKKLLSDYIDACELIRETEQQIRRLRAKQSETTQDSVRGSNPEFPYNAQHFKIEGTTFSMRDDARLLEKEARWQTAGRLPKRHGCRWNAGWLRSRHGCSGLFDGSCLRGLRGKRRRRSWDGRRPGTVCGWNFKDLCQENKSLFVLFTLFVLNII